MSVESNFCMSMLRDWLKTSHNFLNQSKVKPKPIMICSHVFSRTWRRLHVFDLSSDWFIGLSASVVFGQNDYFDFGFTTLNWKLLLHAVFFLYGLYFSYLDCVISLNEKADQLIDIKGRIPPASLFFFFFF